MKRLLSILAILGAAEARAEYIPDLQTCLNAHVGRYEWLLDIHADTPVDEIPGGIWHPGNVHYCGTLGIVRCDRSDDPVACQIDLAERQDRITAAVKRDLPPPAELEGNDWPVRLYEAAHALAHGTSAGPDCAGQPDLFEAWCEANAASHRLRLSVMAWEVARYLGAAPKATEAGWAGPPPVLRPRVRP
ncbi:hypothetical protein [Pseudooceanicola sp.]|uniref:hypothetical protein n=1 Tax=Pseudooceanicola sp. TaxID=1914328 RepID=UPI0035C6BE91